MEAVSDETLETSCEACRDEGREYERDMILKYLRRWHATHVHDRKPFVCVLQDIVKKRYLP